MRLGEVEEQIGDDERARSAVKDCVLLHVRHSVDPPKLQFATPFVGSGNQRDGPQSIAKGKRLRHQIGGVGKRRAAVRCARIMKARCVHQPGRIAQRPDVRDIRCAKRSCRVNDQLTTREPHDGNGPPDRHAEQPQWIPQHPNVVGDRNHAPNLALRKRSETRFS